MSEPKIYVPKSSAKKVEFRDGGSIMKVNMHAETVAQFMKENHNERGYITFVISERRTPDQYGNTHSVALDTWKPKEGEQRTSRPNPAPDKPPVDDDVPF